MKTKSIKTVVMAASAVVAIGLTGFWTQLIYGLIIVVSLSIYSLFRRKE